MHIRRATCVSGHIWGREDEPDPALPEKEDWGWDDVDGTLTPKWTEQLLVPG